MKMRARRRMAYRKAGRHLRYVGWEMINGWRWKVYRYIGGPRWLAWPLGCRLGTGEGEAEGATQACEGGAG